MSPPRPQSGKLSGRDWIKLLSLPVLIVLVYGICVKYNIHSAMHETWMDTHIRHQGLKGIILYIGLVTVLTAVGVPRQLLSFLGGYAFGALHGTVWATLGTGLACCLTFSYARFIGQKPLQQRWGPKLKTVNTFLAQSPFLLTTVVRIMPLGSNFLTNIAAGVSTIPAGPFLTGSMTGFWVQNSIFALMGSGLQLASHWHTLLSGTLYVLSLSLSYWVYRRYKNSQQA
ncbi:MAG: VTT domain-containing protein [Desulfovibrionaceae bacterium]